MMEIEAVNDTGAGAGVLLLWIGGVTIALTSAAVAREDPLEKWISVKEAAEYTGYTTRHIRHLLASKQVKGQKFGRD